MPSTPSLELLAAPSRGATKPSVPKKSSGDFQAVVKKVSSQAEPVAKQAAVLKEPVHDSQKAVSNPKQDSESASVAEAGKNSEAASEQAPEDAPQDTLASSEPVAAEALTEALTAMHLMETGALPGGGAAVGAPQEPLPGHVAVSPEQSDARQVPQPGVAVESSALPLGAAPVTEPEVLKAVAQVQQAHQAPTTNLKGAPAPAAPSSGNALPGAVSVQGTGLTPQGVGSPLALAETPQMLMNWVEVSPEVAETVSSVVGSNTPVEMLDEASGLEMSLVVSAAPDEPMALAEGEAEAGPASINAAASERGVSDTAKATAAAAPPAPPRAEDVLPQILKHAEVMKAQQQNSIKLQLYPEHLGKLEIKVMSHQGVLSAQLTADSLQVKGLLETQMVSLQRSLQEMGLRVDRVEVALNTSNAGGFEGSNASFADSSPQQREQNPPPTARLAVQYGNWGTEEPEVSYGASPKDFPEGAGFINAVA